jgi:hypothetical protein
MRVVDSSKLKGIVRNLVEENTLRKILLIYSKSLLSIIKIE